MFSRSAAATLRRRPRTLALATPHPDCIALRACRVARAAVCRIRPGRRPGSAERPTRPAAAAPLAGADCRAPGRQAAHLRGPAEPPAARRHLVLPPGRRVRGRLRALVCPARPGRVEEIRVPHNWNAKDTLFNKASVGWYRKEFTLPASPKKAKHFWKVRFEGSNYRTKVWLNGKAIGGFTGYFPFEADLDGLRKGRNTLVVKVSSLRSNTDLTHWRPAAFNGYGTGGWWNFGGLLREVYVRKIDTIDIEDVQVVPRLRKVGGPAKVEVRVALRNLTEPRPRTWRSALTVDGERFALEPETVVAGGRRELIDQLHDRQAPAVATRQPQALRHDRGGPGRGKRLAQLSPALRGAQARDPPRRRDPAERQAPQPARREHPRGRQGRGRRALPGHAQPARLAPARSPGLRHPFPLPAPPGLPRGIRPLRDPVLGRRPGLPAPNTLLRPVRRAEPPCAPSP